MKSQIAIILAALSISLISIKLAAQNGDCCVLHESSPNRSLGEEKVKLSAFEFNPISTTSDSLYIQFIISHPDPNIQFDSLQCHFGQSVMLYDDGLDGDKEANDNVFTSKEKYIRHQPVETIEQLLEYDIFSISSEAIRIGAIEFFATNTETNEQLNNTLNYISMGYSFSPEFIEQTAHVPLHKSESLGVKYNKNLINLYGDDYTADITHGRGEYILSNECLNYIDYLDSIWCTDNNFIAINYSMDEMFSSTPAAAYIINSDDNPHVHLTLIKDKGTINHEINHFFSKENFFSRNRNHWDYIKLDRTAYGTGLYAGVYQGSYTSDDTLFVYGNFSGGTAASRDFNFNNLELANMGLIPFDSIRFPIECIDEFIPDFQNSENCDPPMNYPHCREISPIPNVIALEKEDYVEQYNENRTTLIENGFDLSNGGSLDIRFVILSSVPLPDYAMKIFSHYIDLYKAYLVESSYGLIKLKDIPQPTCFQNEFISDIDGDSFFTDTDCDDNNIQVNPNQIEIVYNGLDDDCNPSTLDDDIDQDGFLLVDDCNDGDFNINPAAVEIPNNGIDEDCDGQDAVTSTNELDNTAIHIYPNPTRNSIKIEIEGLLDFIVNLYSPQGKLVYSDSNVKQISVGDLAIGAYLLEIINNNSNEKIVERVIVTN